MCLQNLMFGFRSSMKAHLANFILNKNKVIVNVQVIRMKLQNLEVDPLWDNFKNAILHHSKPKSLRSIYIYIFNRTIPKILFTFQV